jgi:hypothetical protein
LNKIRVARIATIDYKDGFPHIVPICFVYDGTRFYTSLRKGNKRYNNIIRRSSISLVFDEYEEKDGHWITLKGIFMKVKATFLNFHDHNKQFMEGWKLLIEKYPQYKNWANPDLSPTDPEMRCIMQMDPISIVSWGFTQ